MTDLAFAVLDARAEPHAAVPTLNFRLRIEAGAPIHSILLRARLQIEPRRRRHLPVEQERMEDLFGAPERWADTLRPLIWTQTSSIIPAFDRAVEVDLPVVCTYDFEVAAAHYFESLEGGEVPLLFLFSGTLFAKAEHGFRVEQVPWDKEAAFRMPLDTWRNLLDQYFPGCNWIRLRRESLQALRRFRTRNALLSWDDTIEALVAAAEAPVS